MNILKSIKILPGIFMQTLKNPPILVVKVEYDFLYLGNTIHELHPLFYYIMDQSLCDQSLTHVNVIDSPKKVK